jgi:hypothetical protein
MSDSTKIFVGSSSQALKVAELIGEVIKRAEMEPLLWNTEFPPGETLVETIEGLPSDIEGAVLIATADVCCRRGENNYAAAVENVIFEYGYLAARLARRRVAICKFDGVTIPSDLAGVKVIEAGNYKQDDPLPLPEPAQKSLLSWLQGLPLLAEGIPPIAQFHGYSGKWKVENNFSIWRGRKLGEKETVTFNGTTFLLLAADGKRGSGTQSGVLSVKLEGYRATYRIMNEVIEASVNEKGTLKMTVEVAHRELISESGKPPDDLGEDWLKDLRNKPDFPLILNPRSGKFKSLYGTHTYKPGRRLHQEAKEYYEYLDL